LRWTLWFIALVQFILGAGFLLAPEGMAAALQLPATPGWANWMFGMMAVRFLGFGYGMLLAARDPLRHRPWLAAMVAIQAVDWLVTARYLLAGAVTLSQVSTAPFLPLLFIGVILWCWPRGTAAQAPAA
jgi:hypothetical protein